MFTFDRTVVKPRPPCMANAKTLEPFPNNFRTNCNKPSAYEDTQFEKLDFIKAANNILDGYLFSSNDNKSLYKPLHLINFSHDQITFGHQADWRRSYSPPKQYIGRSSNSKQYNQLMDDLASISDSIPVADKIKAGVYSPRTYLDIQNLKIKAQNCLEGRCLIQLKVVGSCSEMDKAKYMDYLNKKISNIALNYL